MHECWINSPKTTIVSEKHWLFSETQGINLAIRLLKEITIKPSLMRGAAFVVLD